MNILLIKKKLYTGKHFDICQTSLISNNCQKQFNCTQNTKLNPCYNIYVENKLNFFKYLKMFNLQLLNQFSR